MYCTRENCGEPYDERKNLADKLKSVLIYPKYIFSVSVNVDMEIYLQRMLRHNSENSRMILIVP